MKWYMTHQALLAAGLIGVLFAAANSVGIAQQFANKEPVATPGDQPNDPGPLATNISSAVHARQIRAAMRRVADWQLQRIQAQPLSRSWEYGVLDVGLMAASRTLGDPRYGQYVASVGKKHNWALERTPYPANDYAVAQAFLDAYRSSHKEDEIVPLRRQFDADMQLPDDPARPAWWWCDALFMEPGAGAELAQLTGDPKYAQYIDREWEIAEKLLYDPQKHLFSRDASFLDRHEKNGEKIFWSRGNGWVMGGIVRILETLPANDPFRSHYVELLQQMSAEIASIQGRDGLWRPGLLDAENYPLPEISGSAFFTYAIAWGINHHILDAKIYRPVVEKAWRGMLTQIYADGRLGCIQQLGDSPAPYQASASYVYGVGAFLLAGSELDGMSQHLRQ